MTTSGEKEDATKVRGGTADIIKETKRRAQEQRVRQRVRQRRIQRRRAQQRQRKRPRRIKRLHGSSKGYKDQGKLQQIKGKKKQQLHEMPPGHWAQDCRAQRDAREKEKNYNYRARPTSSEEPLLGIGARRSIGGINKSHLATGRIRHASDYLALGRKHHTQFPGMTAALTTNSTHKRTQLHLDMAAATRKQNNARLKTASLITSSTSNFKSYQIFSLTQARLPMFVQRLRADPPGSCGESVPQLYIVTNKKISVCDTKYVCRQGNLRIMMPHSVCGLKYRIISASRQLDRLWT